MARPDLTAVFEAYIGTFLQDSTPSEAHKLAVDSWVMSGNWRSKSLAAICVSASLERLSRAQVRAAELYEVIHA